MAGEERLWVYEEVLEYFGEARRETPAERTPKGTHARPPADRPWPPGVFPLMNAKKKPRHWLPRGWSTGITTDNKYVFVSPEGELFKTQRQIEMHLLETPKRRFAPKAPTHATPPGAWPSWLPRSWKMARKEGRGTVYVSPLGHRAYNKRRVQHLAGEADPTPRVRKTAYKRTKPTPEQLAMKRGRRTRAELLALEQAAMAAKIRAQVEEKERPRKRARTFATVGDETRDRATRANALRSPSTMKKPSSATSPTVEEMRRRLMEVGKSPKSVKVKPRETAQPADDDPFFLRQPAPKAAAQRSKAAIIKAGRARERAPSHWPDGYCPLSPSQVRGGRADVRPGWLPYNWDMARKIKADGKLSSPHFISPFGKVFQRPCFAKKFIESGRTGLAPRAKKASKAKGVVKSASPKAKAKAQAGHAAGSPRSSRSLGGEPQTRRASSLRVPGSRRSVDSQDVEPETRRASSLRDPGSRRSKSPRAAKISPRSVKSDGVW